MAPSRETVATTNPSGDTWVAKQFGAPRQKATPMSIMLVFAMQMGSVAAPH
jgi:hypothetical protein